ncbi:hypothetical protein [Methylobacterium aquaticum]|uniref:hypothetical protein n=1 Tax=Methylobacterium aquaticum TaxID=270351 RepID=UPI0019339CFD|nr:hypothetical protein [Methylobacterium aquaticum]QRE74221.1 hypothetical protein F1D61_11925 [Methylobacterium aquaticum]
MRTVLTYSFSLYIGAWAGAHVAGDWFPYNQSAAQISLIAGMVIAGLLAKKALRDIDDCAGPKFRG